MTDVTPFEDLLAGHAGLLEDSAHDRWLRAQALFEAKAYRGRSLQRQSKRDEAVPHLKLAELLGGYSV